MSAPSESARRSAKSFPLRLRRALGRVRRRFAVDSFDVFVRSVTDEDREFVPSEGYRFAWATPEDIERCDERHTELNARERREGVARLGCGHRAVIAFSGETAVFTMWVNPRNANVPGQIKRRLASHQLFIYKAFTSPEHRGRQLYKAGMRFVLAQMARDGMRELVGYAHLKKRVSRKGLATVRFTSAGTFTTWSLPGWSYTRVSRALAARLPLEVARSADLAHSDHGTRSDVHGAP